MARRIENECAYCAEEIDVEKRSIGEDWKVYCSQACVDAGESISREEWNQLMRHGVHSQDSIPQDQ